MAIASDDKLYFGTDLIYPATPQPYKAMQEFPLRVAKYKDGNEDNSDFFIPENFDFYRLVATNNTGKSYNLVVRYDNDQYYKKYQLSNVIDGIVEALFASNSRSIVRINSKSVQVAASSTKWMDWGEAYLRIITDTAVPVFRYFSRASEPNRFKFRIEEP